MVQSATGNNNVSNPISLSTEFLIIIEKRKEKNVFILLC